MARQVEPRFHTSGSQFAQSVAEGSNRGFRWGLLGAVIGLAAIPAAGALFATFGPAIVSSWMGPWLGAGIATALSLPAIGFLGLVGGGIGAMEGFGSGSADSRNRTNSEDLAARFEVSKAKTLAELRTSQMVLGNEPSMAFATGNAVYHPAMAANQNKMPSLNITTEDSTHQGMLQERAVGKTVGGQ